MLLFDSCSDFGVEYSISSVLFLWVLQLGSPRYCVSLYNFVFGTVFLYM